MAGLTAQYLQCRLRTDTVYSPAQGILITQRLPGQATLLQALMYLDAYSAELKIVGAVGGRPVAGGGCVFHTLRGALTAFPQWAASSQAAASPSAGPDAAKPAPAVVSLHADSSIKGAGQSASLGSQPYSGSAGRIGLAIEAALPCL